MNTFPYAELEAKLGYTFHDKQLLITAFTHSSYASRHGGRDNERLEYLGDSVLQLVVTEWQYRGNERDSEGKMTAQRQKLVCRNALDSAVDALGIFPYLLFDGGDCNVGDKAKSSLFEAVTAAIYLDGGYARAKKFIEKHGNLFVLKESGNPKGELKEYLEKRGASLPKAEFEKKGKDNSPYFWCKLTAMGESAKGEGKTKKIAEAIASERLLWELSKKYGKAPAKPKKKK